MKGTIVRLAGYTVAVLVAAVLWSAQGVRAADTLAARIDDAAFWTLIEETSEPDGAFQSENLLSNETGFQAVIPPLEQSIRPDGVYLGVGPEQNFTYIVALRPRIAFIIDIRRQNLLEHLIYKALFELSATRADFLSRLFCRKRPDGLSDRSTADELFGAYGAAPSDRGRFAKNLQDITDLLRKTHKFGLMRVDERTIGRIYTAFHDFGPEINYNSAAGRVGGGMPNYRELMTATDLQGQQRSYLASEENYRVIRDLERRNLVVPLTGDFGGRKAIRSVGQYLKDHGATVTTFYLSNVERYLFQGSGVNHNGGWTSFYNNVAALPLDSASTFIRSVSGGVPGSPGGMRLPSVLASIQETLAAVKDGRIRTYDDVFSLTK